MQKLSITFDHSLQLDLESFGFVQREKRGDAAVAFRCGRDFLYYVLHYYQPNKYNPQNLNPKQIEDVGVFGARLPWWFMWSSLQFTRVPKLMRDAGLELCINNRHIKSFASFFWSIAAPRRVSVEDALRVVEDSIDKKEVVGIDISLGLFGLVDHILFVYAYDAENLYVFDTHDLGKKLEYEKLTPESDNRFIMKLPKSIIRKRWTRFGRVWTVKKVA